LLLNDLRRPEAKTSGLCSLDSSARQVEISNSKIPIKPERPCSPANVPKPAIALLNAEQARHYQEAWATYLNVPLKHTNALDMKFSLIPPGEF